MPSIKIAALFLEPASLAQGSGFRKVDYFISFLNFTFMSQTWGDSPFFLLKAFLTLGIESISAKVLGSDSELEF